MPAFTCCLHNLGNKPMKSFNKESLYLFFLYFLFSYHLGYSQTTETTKWHKIDSPVYSDLTNLTLFTYNSGTASGKQILFLKNDEWKKITSQPPFNVNLLSAINFNSIYVTTITKYQESEMYYWDGKNWSNIYHPLANVISSMYFIDKNNGVISGLGEIAILKNKKWKFLPPPTNNTISKVILKKDKTIWALSLTKGLFKRDKLKWERIKNSSEVHLMEVLNKKIFVLGNNFFGYVLADSIKKISLNKQLKTIRTFSLLNENELFAAGSNGLILHYVNKKWIKLKTPVTATLNSIKMTDSLQGWCVGNDGTILHFTNKNNNSTGINNWKGFEQISFYSDSKVIDDEYGVVTADFNNDGLTDIFTIGLYENNHLYMNTGHFKFIDESKKRGVSGKKNKNDITKELNLGACAGDFDNDGQIDIYTSSLTTKNRIYHNSGEGNFTDYSNISGGVGKPTDRTNAVISGDVDNDGDLDLFICNENTTNRFYLNNGAGIFTEVTKDVNLTSRFGGTGASFSDIDNDGDLDLFVTNWSAKNKLYKNLLVESGKLKFTDFTDSANVGGYVFTKSNGIVFSDIDNDGDMDLFVANRKTSNEFYINNGKGIFSNQTKKYFGNDSLKSYGVVITDFDYDGYKDLYLSNVGENKFYKNTKGEKFIDKTDLFDANVEGYSTGLSAADFNNDNIIDLYVANYVGSSSTVLKNKLDSAKIVTIKLNGINNNTLGIGSKIYAFESGYLNNKTHLIYYNEISGGSGYGSMNSVKQFIPCGNKSNVDIKIIFPKGETIIKKSVPCGSNLLIKDANGFEAGFIYFRKYVTRFLFDNHRFFEFLKWLVVLILLTVSAFRGRKKYKWTSKNIFITSVLIALFYYFLQTIFEYDNLLFSTILPIAGIGIILLVIQLFSERTKLKRLNELEKQKLQEKLSRDLHDDLASTLGTISIYLELLKQALNNNSDNVWTLFNKANSLLTNAKQTITDLIWTIKPFPEPLTNFATRLRENFSDVFRNKNIIFHVSEKDISNNISLAALEKHNIYLIIKEALNNILKHSQATKVDIKISNKNGNIFIAITDNGTGFNFENKIKSGNGISNMITRGKEVNAKVQITTKEKIGTEIKIIIKK